MMSTGNHVRFALPLARSLLSRSRPGLTQPLPPTPQESTPGTVTNTSGTFPQPFAAFATRFAMPANGNANYYYSWSYCIPSDT